MNPDSTLLIFHAFQAVENRASNPLSNSLLKTTRNTTNSIKDLWKICWKSLLKTMKLTMNEYNKKNPLETLYRCLLNLLLISLFSTMIFNKFFKTPSLSHFLLNTFSATNLDTLVNKIMRSFKLSMINNYSYSDKECCVAKCCIMYTNCDLYADV